jgi:hypothetical protein
MMLLVLVLVLSVLVVLLARAREREGGLRHCLALLLTRLDRAYDYRCAHHRGRGAEP